MLVPGSREWRRRYREATRFLARMEERLAPEYRRNRDAARRGARVSAERRMSRKQAKVSGH
jgi:hypothetical protein